MSLLREILFEEVKKETKMVQFDAAAKRVWAEKDVEKKRALLVKEIVNNFKFKEKQDTLRAKAMAMKSGAQLDKLAGDLMLVGHGEKVVR